MLATREVRRGPLPFWPQGRLQRNRLPVVPLITCTQGCCLMVGRESLPLSPSGILMLS